MKKTYLILILVIASLLGCRQYTKVDTLELGMNEDDVLATTESCIFKGKIKDLSQYSCTLDVPYKYSIDGYAAKPYILTFKNNQLYKIVLYERELDRDAVRDDYYGGYVYYVDFDN